MRRDTEGFAELVREHQAMVFSIAFRFLRDRAVAEELAQDVFLKLHRELPKMESAEHVRYWLRKVITHRAMDYARSACRRHEVALEDVQEPAMAAGRSDPLLETALRKLVASLPAEARMVVVLRYQEEMEPHEIAETLGMSVATVKSRLRRSLVLLRGKAQRLMGEAIERHR
ncbi:MAG TPA: sigma-70 family RNA polymerase sigma factor [Terriglobales bacterium]|nr:sigma-70 family RNA polymerase sigma factor [Terriglobales bacterium]